MSEVSLHSLDSVLNEATLLRLSVHKDTARVEVTYHAWCLAANRSGLSDPRITVRLLGVSRIDVHVEKPGRGCGTFVPIGEDQCETIVRFRGDSQYGGEFIDPEPDWFDKNHPQASLNWRWKKVDSRHRLCTFKEGVECSVVLRVWFDDVELAGSSGQVVSLADIGREAEQWWRGFFDHGEHSGQLVQIPDEWF